MVINPTHQRGRDVSASAYTFLDPLLLQSKLLGDLKDKVLLSVHGVPGSHKALYSNISSTILFARPQFQVATWLLAVNLAICYSIDAFS